MRASDAMSAITAIVPTQRPALFKGPPGCGKSQIVEQVARNLGADLLISHPVTEDPTDPKGMPWFQDGKAEFVPFGTLRRAMEATAPTIWLLDDLGQAPTAVQAAYMQLLLARRVNGHVLSDSVYMLATTNRQQDRAGVNKIITPLLNRFVHLELEVSVDDWQAWALSANIAPDVHSFIRFRPALLMQFDPTSGQESFPTPRSWEFVSQIAGVTPDSLLLPVVAGCVGEGPAAEYIAFRRLYTQLPDPLTVLANPQGTTVPTDPAVLYALIGALVERAKTATDPQINALALFAGRMSAEYGTLLIRDTIAVNQRAFGQPGVSDWVRKHADLFATR